jgi:hypothetical protein
MCHGTWGLAVRSKRRAQFRVSAATGRRRWNANRSRYSPRRFRDNLLPLRFAYKLNVADDVDADPIYSEE